MEKRTMYSVAGLALLTAFALPQAAFAGADHGANKATATENTAAKKAQVLQQQAADAKSGVAGPSGMKGESGTASANSTEVRNWAAIDTNKDHSIQAEEMERYLADSWAAQKKAVQKAK